MSQPSQALYDEADTDGLVVFGSRVIVYTMSGRLVLALTTEQDNSISELIDYCLRKCAANEAMPQVCVGLQWKPLVSIPSLVGLNLVQLHWFQFQYRLMMVLFPFEDGLL